MKYLFAIAIVLYAQFGHAQSIKGTWSGDLAMQNMNLHLVLNITQNGDSLYATLLPAKGAKEIKVDEIAFKDNQLQLVVKRMFAYKGKLEGDSIPGTFIQTGKNIPLTFKRGNQEVIPTNRPQMPKPPFNYNIEGVKFTNPVDTNTLAGTLTTPKYKKQFPVVVMITGSGAQDRDETLFGHKPFWVIADHFTKNGIGVLRLDDRGVGGSSKGKAGATSADFATDIDAAVNYLVKRGYTNIGLVGHSEGGMIAPIVAAKNKNVKFLVSMAGPGIAIDELMLLQTYALSKAGGATEDAARKNVEINKKVYHLAKTYQGDHFSDSVKNLIMQALDNSPEVKYLTEEQKNAIVSQQVTMVSNPWFRYFLKFDPAPYISKLKIPVLAINGSKDVQVIAKDNLAGWKASLQKGGNKNFIIKEFEGLNHLFQEAKTGSLNEYQQIEQTISPAVLDYMTNWILKQK